MEHDNLVQNTVKPKMIPTLKLIFFIFHILRRDSGYLIIK